LLAELKVRRVGDVDKTRQMRNSTLLAPIGHADYVLVNHIADRIRPPPWPRGWCTATRSPPAEEPPSWWPPRRSPPS
jgi:hypothetical protein